MSKLRDAAAVAAATESDPGVVAAALPHILAALEAEGILNTPTVVAALATVAVECRFAPVAEAFWLAPRARARHFDGTKYGKVDPETGQRYFGRGFIQLTWKSNYATYGARLGVDLVNNPDLALQPEIAAKVLARYFVERKIPAAARAGDWRRVRTAVNGGLNGWTPFRRYVRALEELGAEA